MQRQTFLCPCGEGGQAGARIAPAVVGAKPTVIISEVQDELKAIMNLRDEFIRFGGKDEKTTEL